MTDAFHTLRTRGERFSMPRFELLTLIISALEWRKHNGRIKLVTDRRGLEYLRSISLAKLLDRTPRGNNRSVAEIYDELDASLDGIDSLGIDENVFWAGAKLFALRRQQCPCVMIDLDFIVWKPLDFAPYRSDVSVIHFERIDDCIYPPSEHFRFKKNFRFPVALDWTVEACNTAFAYFGARDLVERYCEFAFEFMRAADGEGLPYMVFVEQRWLAMCARLMKRPVHALSSLDELFGGRQKYFTHVWGSKQKLRDDPIYAERFCADCVDRINADFKNIFA